MSLNDNTNKIAAILAKANALPAQLDTSDATASAGDIVKGQTAYVDGAKVTGTRLKPSAVTAKGLTIAGVQGAAHITGEVTENVAIDKGGKVKIIIAGTELGDATPADVAKGKTFTSGSGVKQTGTKEEAAAPSGSISITANGTYDVTDKASAVVNVPQSGGGSPYVTDLGDVSFTHTQESITVDSIGMTGTYDIYTSAEIEAPAELITIIDKANSNNYSETEQYLAQNNIQIIFKDEECGTTGRMDIYAENGWIYGELYVYYSVVPFYYGMLDTVCNSFSNLVSSFLINTHNSENTIAEGKIKIELKLYSQDLVTGYTNDNLFANSHIMLLHADWS